MLSLPINAAMDDGGFTGKPIAFAIHQQLRNLKTGDNNTVLSSEILEICFGQMFYEDLSIPAPFTNHLVLQQQFCCHNLLGNFSAHDLRSLVQNLVVLMCSFIIYFFTLSLNFVFMTFVIISGVLLLVCYHTSKNFQLGCPGFSVLNAS